MEPKAFEDKLRQRISEYRSELSKLTDLAQEKAKQEESLSLDVEVTVQDIFESMERSLDEAEAEIERLGDVTLRAWQTREEEIREQVEGSVNQLIDRFETLADKLKDQ